MRGIEYWTIVRKFVETNFRNGIGWLHLPGVIAWAGVSCGIGTGYALHAGACLFRLPHWWWLLAAIPITVVVGVLTRSMAIRFTAFFAAGIVVGAAHTAREYQVYGPLVASADEQPAIHVLGKVISPPQPWFENFHFLLRIDTVFSGARCSGLSGLAVSCISADMPPQYGTVEVRGRFLLPRRRKNPCEFDEYGAMMAKGIWGTIEASVISTQVAQAGSLERLSLLFRASAIRTLQKVSDYDHRAVLQACFLGDTEFLSPYIKDLFRRAGIYHLIAISGLNTAMLTAALYFLLRLLPLGRHAPHLICIAALWLYLLFVGTIPSLFRATVMATLVIVSLLFERKVYALHTLGLAGTVWLLLAPSSIASPGYQLSFAATAALVLLFPPLYRCLPPLRNRFVGIPVVFLYSSLCISIVTFCATLPILVYHFGTVSWFGIVANCAAVAAMTVSMWAFFVALLVEPLIPAIVGVPLWISERFLDIITGVGGLARHVPFSQIEVPSPGVEVYAIGIAFMVGCAAVRRERFLRYCAISLIAAAVIIPAGWLIRQHTGTVEAVHFALAGNDVLGIQWPGRSIWLICGNVAPSCPARIERQVAPWVRRRGKTAVETVLAPPYLFREGQWNGFDSVRILQGARLLAYPDVGSAAAYYPCTRCTCSVATQADSLRVRLSHDALATTVSLYTGPARRRTGSEKRGAAGARIYRIAGDRVTMRVLGEGPHPLTSRCCRNNSLACE